MPTYDYLCHSCNETIEVFHSITAEPLQKCEKCGRKMERQIGAGAGIIFKGSGFFATDYKKPSPETSSVDKKEKNSSNADKKESSPSKPDSCSSSGSGSANKS